MAVGSTEREAYNIQRKYLLKYGTYYPVGSVLQMLRCNAAMRRHKRAIHAAQLIFLGSKPEGSSRYCSVNNCCSRWMAACGAMPMSGVDAGFHMTTIAGMCGGHEPHYVAAHCYKVFRLNNIHKKTILGILSDWSSVGMYLRSNNLNGFVVLK